MDGSSHECVESLGVAFKHLFRQPPEDEKGCRGDQKEAKEQESVFYFLWPVRVLGLGNINSGAPSPGVRDLGKVANFWQLDC